MRCIIYYRLDDGLTIDLLQIYNISSDQWSQGPNMSLPREEHGCVISPEINTLYAIAGESRREMNGDWIRTILWNMYRSMILIHGDIPEMI